jgi:hypothetical protein
MEKIIQFEVENINGKIQIKSEQKNLNKKVGIIRFITKNYNIFTKTFKYKNVPYFLNEYTWDNRIQDVIIYPNIFVDNIDNFDFSYLKKNNKMTVILFPEYHQTYFPSEILIPSDYQSNTKFPIAIFGANTCTLSC